MQLELSCVQWESQHVSWLEEVLRFSRNLAPRHSMESRLRAGLLVPSPSQSGTAVTTDKFRSAVVNRGGL
jgi:hypothetical protein